MYFASCYFACFVLFKLSMLSIFWLIVIVSEVFVFVQAICHGAQTPFTLIAVLDASDRIQKLSQKAVSNSIIIFIL